MWLSQRKGVAVGLRGGTYSVEPGKLVGIRPVLVLNHELHRLLVQTICSILFRIHALYPWSALSVTSND